MRRDWTAWLLIVGLVGCHSDTPEAAVRKAFDTCVRAAEAGEADTLVAHLHPAFAGPEGLDRAQARFFLLGAFRQGKVGVTVWGNQVDVKGSRAQQVVEVVLTRRGQGTLLPEETSRHTFHLRWERHEKAWKLRELREP